jgi:hypothetical protein
MRGRARSGARWGKVRRDLSQHLHGLLKIRQARGQIQQALSGLFGRQPLLREEQARRQVAQPICVERSGIRRGQQLLRVLDVPPIELI